MIPATVWLASYPKSGNTWLRVLLDNWFADSAGPSDINNLTPLEWSPNNPTRFASATLLPAAELLPGEIEQLRAPATQLIASEIGHRRTALVKIHNAYTPAFGPGVARAAIYLVRDPRDVVPSLAAHLNISIEQAIDTLNSPTAILGVSSSRVPRQLPQPLSDWSGHVRGWLDESDLRIHVVRYEDLPGAFAGVLEFLGQPPDASRLEKAIRYSRIEELQSQERAKGFKEGERERPFFRQGRSGAWRHVLTPSQTARIESTHAHQMQRFAYV